MALPPSATTMRLSFWVMTLHSVGGGTSRSSPTIPASTADPHRDDTPVGHGRRPAPRWHHVRRRPRDRLPAQPGGRGRAALRVGAARGHAARRGLDRGAVLAAGGHGSRARGGRASTVAHSGGVVLGLYLVGRPLSGAGVVATGTLAYAISDVVKVGTYAAIGWVTPPLLLATVAATPLLYLGSWLGYRLNARLPRRAFALTLVAIALTGALRLLLS